MQFVNYNTDPCNTVWNDWGISFTSSENQDTWKRQIDPSLLNRFRSFSLEGPMKIA